MRGVWIGAIAVAVMGGVAIAGSVKWPNVVEQFQSETQRSNYTKFGGYDQSNWNHTRIKWRVAMERQRRGKHWVDEFSGKMYHDERALVVTPIVPITHAHRAGLYRRPHLQRQMYLHLGLSQHYVVMSVNSYKQRGSKGPDKWMPENSKYHCRYLKKWIEAKVFYNLDMEVDEYLAAKRILKEQKCDIV